MKNRGKFLAIPALLVLLASLAVVAVLPALAATTAVTLAVRDTTGGADKSTTVSGIQYVSNAEAAFEFVNVSVVLDAAVGATTTGATVQNLSTGASTTTDPLVQDVSTSTIYAGEFRVLATATTTGGPNIAASDGHIIRVIHDVVVKQLTVDAVKPSLASLAPASGTLTQAATIQFSGTVTDSASGIAGTTAAPETGAITIVVDGVDRTGLASWAQVTGGYSFSIIMFLTLEGEHTWQVTAKDRVGNTAVSDSDATTDGNQTHKITLDSKPPILARVQTGKGYDTTAKKVVTSRKSVMLEFITFGTADPDTTANFDLLDGGSLDVSDFLVAGAAPTAVVFPNIKVADTADAIETRNKVFLTLASDLAADAKPLTRIVGIVKDVAGNSQSTGDKEALDRIAPAFTVTITGDVNTGVRPVTGGASTSKTTIRVVSDETLSAAPTVSLSTLVATTTTPFVVVDTLDTVTAAPVTGVANTWEVSRTITQAPGSGSRLINVTVGQSDASGINLGTAGQGAPTASAVAVAGTKVDLTKAVLFEFDNTLPTPTASLIPAVTGQPTQTDSTGPSIKVDFGTEGTEYAIADLDADGSTDKVTVSTGKTVEVDTYNAVTLTKVTLDGVDVLAGVGKISANSFQVSTSGLALGAHTLLVSATDDAGNKVTDFKYEFTVIARVAHKISLFPGWNLVSFPGDPKDPDINVVLAGNAAISSVLSYDPADVKGPWLVATRNATTGKLEGTLTKIDGQRAYWVSTTTFDAVSTLLSERTFSQLPPTIPIVAGWNLVSVADFQLQVVGTVLCASTYLASLAGNWTVAYYYDASINTWKKILPTSACSATPVAADAGAIKLGWGLWVFATKSGSLVP